jgi:hypothetical protein
MGDPWGWLGPMLIMVLPLVAIAMYITVSRVKEHSGRFSLRTLLIATTLVAVVLGLIIYVGSK